MSVLKEPFTAGLCIDNAQLDGFIDYFKKADCLHLDCDRCGYCAEVAAEAVSVDEKWRQQMLERFDRAIEILTGGEISGITGAAAV